MKTDARIRYTKKVIKESLIQLLKEKPIQKITVTELCELAEINRATFYTHYQDNFDLLEQIENELFDDVTEPIFAEAYGNLTDFHEVTGRIEKNAELCQVLFSENGDKMFLRRIVDASRETMIADWKKHYPEATRQQLLFTYAFVIGGSISVIEEWVRSGMKEAPIGLEDISRRTVDTWLQVKS